MSEIRFSFFSKLQFDLKILSKSSPIVYSKKIFPTYSAKANLHKRAIHLKREKSLIHIKLSTIILKFINHAINIIVPCIQLTFLNERKPKQTQIKNNKKRLTKMTKCSTKTPPTWNLNFKGFRNHKFCRCTIFLLSVYPQETNSIQKVCLFNNGF